MRKRTHAHATAHADARNFPSAMNRGRRKSPQDEAPKRGEQPDFAPQVKFRNLLDSMLGKLNSSENGWASSHAPRTSPLGRMRVPRAPRNRAARRKDAANARPWRRHLVPLSRVSGGANPDGVDEFAKRAQTKIRDPPRGGTAIHRARIWRSTARQSLSSDDRERISCHARRRLGRRAVDISTPRRCTALDSPRLG